MKKVITLFLAISMSGVSAFAFDILEKRNFKKKRSLLEVSSGTLLQKNTSFLKRGEGGEAFKEGTFAISAGYGWPNLGKAFIQAIIDASSRATGVSATGLGPLHFRGEYALSDGVGLAASVNYISFGAKWTSYNDTTGFPYDNKISRTSLSLLARLNFHFGTTDKLDPYFGVGAGYKNTQWKLTSDDPMLQEDKVKTFSPFGFEMTIGLRYYFTPGFGFYTEMGIAKSIVQAGLVAAF